MKETQREKREVNEVIWKLLNDVDIGTAVVQEDGSSSPCLPDLNYVTPSVLITSQYGPPRPVYLFQF